MNGTGSPKLLALVEFSDNPAPSWIGTAAAKFGLDALTLPSASLAGTDLPRPNRANACPRPRSFFVSADIFLFNAAELLESLGSDGPNGPNPTHPDIVLAAYLKWDLDCAAQLEGEFAFAIFDEAKSRLFCVRDAFAMRPFLYWCQGNRIALSGDIVHLLGIPGIPRELNRRKLAAHSVFFGEVAVEGETYHAGIHNLPNGCMMTVGPHGVKVTRYWAPQTREGIVPRKPEDAFAELRHMIFRSVEQRINRPGNVAILLSGGLDSSALAAVAARIMEQQGRRLQAVSVVAPEKDLHRIQDERSYIEVFRSFPNIDIHYAPVENCGPYDWIDEPERFTAFPHPQPMLHASHAKLADLAKSGTSVVLTGGGGEVGPTAGAQSELFLMLASGRWSKAFDEARKRSALTDTNPLRLVLGSLRAYLAFERKTYPLFLLSSGFTRECTARPQWVPHCASHAELALHWFTYLTRHSSMRSAQWQKPVQEALPFFDKSIIEFCISAPGELKFRDGHTRYMIRGAMEGVVPESLRWRRKKFPFIVNYEDRHNAQVHRAQAFVQLIGSNDPVRSVVDVPRLIQLAKPTTSLDRKQRWGLHASANTIRLIQFLRQFPDFRA